MGKLESMLYPRMTATRREEKLDGMWKFCFDPQEKGECEGWADGLPGRGAGVDLLPVPASFADFFTEKEKREFTGDFWYERDFFVPGEWQGTRVYLRFGSVTHRADVYVNGKKAGSHEGGFLPFSLDITEKIRYNETNRVVVKGNNELADDTLPAGKTKVLPSGRKMTKPYFDFFNYAGIHRSVWLVSVPKHAVEDYTLSYRLEGADAVVSYEVELTECSESLEQKGRKRVVKLSVYDEQGTLTAENKTEWAETDGTLLKGEVRIPQVRLWKVRDAYLYRFCFQLYEGDELLDEYWEDQGIRTIEVKGCEILLNGEPVYLKGFGKHEDSDIIGKGFSAGVMKRDFELMKWIGANSFRTSHYPYSEEIYQMADQEGFLVIDELPAVGFMESLQNFDVAALGEMVPFFSKPTTERLLSNHLNALEEMIKRDKNHACVIMWSLMNEPETTSESAVDYFAKVFERARELDAQKRPRTFAMLMTSLPDRCHCYSFSDVLSLNRYYGWYVAGGYEIEEAEAMFRKEMDAWAAKGLNKPFIFTEYGADTYASEHKLPSVMWSQEYQKEYLEMYSRIFDSYEFIQGEQVWNFADFQTTEGIKRVDGNKKGIFTRQRQPKESAFYLKERWENL